MTVWTSPSPLTTDFTVRQQDGATPGHAAAAAAKEKDKFHKTVVSSLGHTFIPFSCEAHGFMDASVFKFIEYLCMCRPDYEHTDLRHDIILAVNVALARARITAVGLALDDHERILELVQEQEHEMGIATAGLGQ